MRCLTVITLLLSLVAGMVSALPASVGANSSRTDLEESAKGCGVRIAPFAALEKTH